MSQDTCPKCGETKKKGPSAANKALAESEKARRLAESVAAMLAHTPSVYGAFAMDSWPPCHESFDCVDPGHGANCEWCMLAYAYALAEAEIEEAN